MKICTIEGCDKERVKRRDGTYVCGWCYKHNLERSAENDALKNRAAARLGLTMRKSLKVDLTNDWLGLPKERRKAELAYQRELEANTEPTIVPQHPALPYSELTPQEQRIIDERKDAYEPQDRKEQQRREGSVYCRVLGVRKVNGRMTPVCKIGYAGVVKDREQECDRWSIDGDEVTEWRIEHTNARWLETEVHNELKMRGKHRRKEIFNVTPAEARQIAEIVLEMAGYDNTHSGPRSEQPTAGSD